MFNFLLAQAQIDVQNNSALLNLEQSIQLSRATFESWQQVWNEALNPDSALWIALVRLGLLFAGLSIIYLVFTQGKEIIDRQSWSELVGMFIWPIVIVIFLGNTGGLLSQSVLLIKTVGQAQVQGVLDLQLGQATFQAATSNIVISDAVRDRIASVYNECKGLPPGKLQECWQEKQPLVRQILTEAQNRFGINFDIPDIQNFSIDISGPFLFIVRKLLLAAQWAFVNILEAALLLTALFSPIAMGLSLLPFQGRPILAWLIGMFSLIGIQLGYNIIVGLCSVVMTTAQNQGQGFSISDSDLAFLLFLAIFSPGLAVLIAGGGGVAVYQGISANVKGITDTISNAIGTVASIAITKMN